MSIVRHTSLERISTFDLSVPQRWARRTATRLAKHQRRYTGLYGRGELIAESGGAPDAIVLGGLEVFCDGGGSVLGVSAGLLLYRPLTPAPVTEARQATFTFQDPIPGSMPAAPEPDDDSTHVLYDNAFERELTWSIASPLAANEWWVVYATLAPATTTESDTGRVKFNEVTGAWDPTTTAKVLKDLLTFGIARGTASSGLPAIPSDAVAIALVHVPQTATDLSQAMIFDARPLHDPALEPNTIGGSWQVKNISGPNFLGHVWAHHRGEHMEFRAGTPVPISYLCSPGATWDGTASPSSPKIAWLYLARAENGSVPRLKQRGDAPLATDATSAQNVYGQGVLVVSPVRPNLGLGPSQNMTAGRWDMRSSAAIPLPSHGTLLDGIPIVYNFAGQSCPAEGAICVGMLVYDGVSGGVPNVLLTNVDANGWMRGAAIRQASATTSTGVVPNSPIARSSIVGISTQNIGFLAQTQAVGSFSVPIDALELTASVEMPSGVALACDDGQFIGASASGYVRFRSSVQLPGGATVGLDNGGLTPSGVADPAAFAAGITAVRMPYGTPLYT